MVTRLIGTDSEFPRLPQGVIDATQGTTATDLAPGDVLAQSIAYTDAQIAAGGVGGGGETVDTGELYRVILFADGTVRGIPITATNPDVPTGLARIVRIAFVKLTWTAVTGATSYLIYRGGTQIATSGTNSYRDGTVLVSSTYSYTVRAVNTYGLRSDHSTAVTAFVDPALNRAPEIEVRTWPASAIALGNRAVVRVNTIDVDGQTLAIALGVDAGDLVATFDPSVWILEPLT
jgi:hypothetical protein